MRQDKTQPQRKENLTIGSVRAYAPTLPGGHLSQEDPMPLVTYTSVFPLHFASSLVISAPISIQFYVFGFPDHIKMTAVSSDGGAMQTYAPACIDMISLFTSCTSKIDGFTTLAFRDQASCYWLVKSTYTPEY